ncbi:hypothetical protein A2997_00940 [Candidatus Nomurabacteria bacterium RIFCSPLOWO2_01_FULL_36_10b]|uniref:Transcriptional regulator n=1 Tax=Candidatus Nomurabacteria bacterium RIFCSPLOWO2_01_FULL_36_10b TaxID=1801766 RepID=A0A1F6WPD4_9BACT|nr:MAG: hypothetical protein A2997_00940 [Candidatus Nomurabacteria bacterium RIFCSPLOWO2_01_FULL_36_10b]
MEKLATIFDSSARVKIMRLFLFSPDTPFDAPSITERSKVNRPIARKEVSTLLHVGFLKPKSYTKFILLKSRRISAKRKSVSKKVTGWILNKDFPLVEPLRSLLIDSELIHTQELQNRFSVAGSIKMLVLSGIFMKNYEQGVDVIIVGDKLNAKKLSRVMSNLEAEVGKELRYSVFTPAEFQYRLQMYDQHLLDVFSSPHERVVDKLGLPLET